MTAHKHPPIATPARTARRPRAAAGALLAALLAPTALLAAAPPAAAASYRYWTYWNAPAGRDYAFGTAGPTSAVPADGSVEGWRFAVSGIASSTPPRTSAGFAWTDLCVATGVAAAKARGEKVVAVVVDPGTPLDAPPGQVPPPPYGTCVRVPANATGAEVLRVAGYRLRFGDGGLLCAIGGYPRRECAAAVADPLPTSTPTPTATASPTRSPIAASPPALPPPPQTQVAPPPTPRPATTAPRPATPTTTASPTATAPPTTTRPGATAPATGPATVAASPGTTPTPSNSTTTPDAGPSLSAGPPTDQGGASTGTILATVLGVLVVGGVAAAAYVRSRGRAS